MNFIGKTLKKKLTLITLAVVVFCTGIFTVGGISSKKAYALSPEYNGASNTIYYFTDYYPTLTYDELLSESNGYNIVFDRQSITESEFTDMIDNGYFSGFEYGTCVVIIDIKTFMPDFEALKRLFFDLQQSQDCKTIFVSAYYEENCGYDFMEYVNVFVNDAEFVRLKSFVNNALINLNYMNSTLDSTIYLIERCLVDVHNYGYDFDELCNASPFLRFLLEQLAARLGISYSSSYGEIADSLRDYHYIKLLVQTDDYLFVDILTGNYYDNIYEVMSENKDIYFACAFGFLPFNDNYYNILSSIQKGDISNILVYSLVVDPVNFGDGILGVITDSMLEIMYGYEYNDAAQRLLEALRSLLI